MKLRLEIDMENAAFEYWPEEAVRILRKAADKIDESESGSAFSGCLLHDINGNKVGRVDIED